MVDASTIIIVATIFNIPSRTKIIAKVRKQLFKPIQQIFKVIFSQGLARARAGGEAPPVYKGELRLFISLFDEVAQSFYVYKSGTI